MNRPRGETAAMATSHKAIKLTSAEGPRTLIVVGCGRGGTSLVAGAAIILGVAMGSTIDSVIHEDMEWSMPHRAGTWTAT